jgi:hypothetical protein
METVCCTQCMIISSLDGDKCNMLEELTLWGHHPFRYRSGSCLDKQRLAKLKVQESTSLLGEKAAQKLSNGLTAENVRLLDTSRVRRVAS